MTSQSRVRVARRFAGLSQTELAALVGVHRSAVSHWESRHARNPAMAHLRSIAEATGVSFEWLATGRGAMGLSAETMMDAIPAADAMLVDDPLEMRLVAAFRAMPDMARIALTEIAEQLGAQKGQRRGR